MLSLQTFVPRSPVNASSKQLKPITSDLVFALEIKGSCLSNVQPLANTKYFKTEFLGFNENKERCLISYIGIKKPMLASDNLKNIIQGLHEFGDFNYDVDQNVMLLRIPAGTADITGMYHEGYMAEVTPVYSYYSDRLNVKHVYEYIGSGTAGNRNDLAHPSMMLTPAVQNRDSIRRYGIYSSWVHEEIQDDSKRLLEENNRRLLALKRGGSELSPVYDYHSNRSGSTGNKDSETDSVSEGPSQSGDSLSSHLDAGLDYDGALAPHDHRSSPITLASRLGKDKRRRTKASLSTKSATKGMPTSDF